MAFRSNSPFFPRPRGGTVLPFLSVFPSFGSLPLTSALHISMRTDFPGPPRVVFAWKEEERGYIDALVCASGTCTAPGDTSLYDAMPRHLNVRGSGAGAEAIRPPLSWHLVKKGGRRHALSV